MNNPEQNLTRVSKFLSFVLRHQPGAINLRLDSQGWASVTELIEKTKPQIALTTELIKQTVIENDKKRFSLTDDGQYIRANQGHSIKIDLKLTATEPPARLYHGTATRFLESIMQEGLKPGQRHHVHLSTDVATATAVGQRYGKAVALKVDAASMHKQGHKFFLSDNNIWLTEHVPACFLSY